MSMPSTPTRPPAVLKPNGSAEAVRARGANWAVGLVAAVLLIASCGGYWYHRWQVELIANEHIRLQVTGPAELQAGEAAVYTVVTNTVTGAAIPAHVKFALYPPGKKQPTWYNEVADENGQLEIVVAADQAVAPTLILHVIVSHADTRSTGASRAGANHEDVARDEAELTEETIRTLHVRAARPVVRLVLADQSYQPGDSVTADLQVRPAPMTAVRVDAVVDGASVFCNQHAMFDDAGDLAITFKLPKPNVSAAGSVPLRVVACIGGRREEIVAEIALDRTKPSAAAAAIVDVAFFPEGGTLAAGLLGRVYFVARDAQGHRVAMKGTVVNQNGIQIGQVATIRDGRGSFSFRPHAGDRYTLEITEPAPTATDAHTTRRVALPAVSIEQQIVLNTGTGLFEMGEPLEFNVQATKAGLPLVAVASCHGRPVGQQMLVTTIDQSKGSGANPMRLRLAEDAVGVIRLTLFDFGRSPPMPLAERFVYRRPPVPESAPASDARKAIDLFLGTQNPQRAVAVRDAMVDSDATLPATIVWMPHRDATIAPPTMCDNLEAIWQEYEASVAAYQQRQTHWLCVITTMSFVGSLGLLLLVALLGVLKVMSGVHLWVPAVGVTTCCVVIGVILMEPINAVNEASLLVPFTPVAQPPIEELLAEDMPMEDALVEDVSVEDVSVEDVSVEDVSVEDVSVEDVSVEDVSVEDVSVEDVSVEDVSVEELVKLVSEGVAHESDVKRGAESIPVARASAGAL